jgi:plastocyanin
MELMSASRLQLGVASLAVLLTVGLAYAAQPLVSQKGKVFSVQTLTIKPGEQVIFKNDDDVVHNVFANSKGNEFNLKAQAPGSQNGQVFKNEGVVDVRCAFHPRMKLTIVVKK